MDVQWRPLVLARESRLPPFLFKLDISASAYTIHLTDLTHIWTESLDRKHIIRRAFDENASIDPSEGPDQFRLLLHNIQGALEGRAGTSLKVLLPKAADSLTLNVTAKLPSPLDPLIWPIRLTRAPEDSFFDEFLLPCLTSSRKLRSEVVSLVNHIKEKDKVIARLTDKLEATGIDLCAVFPSAAPSKRSKAATREVVMNSVKGLREFDEKVWREAMAAGPEIDLKQLYAELFSNDTPATGCSDSASIEMMPLSSHSNVSSKPEHKAFETGSATSLARQDFADDEFQRQVTPTTEAITDPDHSSDKRSSPIGVSKSMDSPVMDGNNSLSNTSDDDLDGSVTHIKHSPAVNPPASKKGATKLGILGGKKRDSPRAVSPPARSPSRDVVEKQTDSADQAQEESRAPQVSPSKPKSNLGKIGGLRKADKHTEADAATVKADVPRVPVSSKEASQTASTSERGRETMKKSTSPQPERETSQERADRNRERLKRELVEKSKVAVKKKRKF